MHFKTLAEKKSSKASNAWADRFLAIPGLLITSSFSYALVALHTSGYRGSEGFAQWIKTHRTNTAIAVQVLSHLLGLIHVQVICNLLKTSFVLSLRTRTFPIYQAQFIQAAAVPRMALQLPWRLVILLLLIILMSFAPAAAWAGALAPLIAEKIIIQPLDIPTFDVADTSQLWIGDPDTAIEGRWLSNIGGLFSFDPAASSGLMLSSASDASVLTDGIREHVKLDKSGFVYLDRSYGTGSVVGFQSFPDVTDPNWFKYTEEVLATSVSCAYNDSSLFQIKPVSEGENLPNVYQSHGLLVTGEESGFSTFLGYADADMFAWETTFLSANETLVIQMTTLATTATNPRGFHQLNNIQCDIHFKPQTISVFVNNTSQTVNSTFTAAPPAEWPKYGDAVTDKIMFWIRYMSWADSGCIDGCPLGRSIVTNIRQLQNVTMGPYDLAVLPAVEDYIASMTDNIMVNLILTRMVSSAAQSTTEVFATVGVPAVIFGDFRFVVIVAVINSIISIIYIIECVRTRAWVGIPAFDLTNISDIIIGASKGGMCFERWSGSSTEALSDADVFTNKTRMSLKCNSSASDQPILVPLLGAEPLLLRTISGTEGQTTSTYISQDSLHEQQAFLVTRKPLNDINTSSEVRWPEGQGM